MEPIVLTAARGRLALRMTCVPMGTDLCVALTGGDRAHLGAVALSQPRPSLGGDGAVSATTSVLALLGHKEDELARTLAAELATRHGGVVCFACGIHLDAITPEELAAVPDLARDLAEVLLHRLGHAAPI
jgi:gallate decarboxylase subunit D